MARTIEQRFYIYHAAAINAAGATAQIPFDAADEILNTWGFVLDATNDEIDIPEDGKYDVELWANLDPGAGTTFNLNVLRNPGTGDVTAGDQDVTVSTVDQQVYATLLVTLFKGDAVSFVLDPGAATMAWTETRLKLTRVGNTGD